MSNYDPFRVRRNVRLVDAAADGVIVFATKSFSSDAGEDRYHPSIDLETGAAVCSCPHYTYRLAKLEPNVKRPETLCKHLVRAAGNLRRRSLLLSGGAR